MRYILIFSFLFLSIFVSSQSVTESDEIIRLKSLLEVADLKKQTALYNDLAWEYSYGDYDSAMVYVNRAIEAADRLGDPYWQAVSLEMLAILKEISGQTEDALKLYLRVIPIRESIGGKGLENTFNNMAIIFKTQNNFEKAFEYFQKSYKIEVTNNNKHGISTSLINIAIAEKYLDRKDSLKHHLWEALSIAQEIDDINLQGSAMINLANIYYDDNLLDSALYYFQNALKRSEDSFVKSSQTIALTRLASIYAESGDKEKAMAYFNRAEKLAKSLHSIDLLSKVYEEMATMYASYNDYRQAYAYKNKFLLLHDSLINLELVTQTNELEEKYESEKKERQITELELASAEQELQAGESRSQRKLLYFLAIILALVLFFVTYRYITQQRISKVLSDKNQTIAAALNDREILLKEIHHRVKNNLQVVSSLLSIQGREISDEKALEAVNESKHRVQSMALIHQYLYSDNNLKSIDMKQYIKQLSTNLFHAYKLDHGLVELHIDVEPILLDVDTAIPLGIIINELITNALKYAFPENKEGKLSVKLCEKNQRLNLHVTDNGVGKSAVNESQISFGTKLINAFKSKLKAELEMNTENGYSVLFSIGNYKKL